MNLWDGRNKVTEQKRGLEQIKKNLNSLFSTNEVETSSFEQPDYLKSSMFTTNENSDPF